MNETENNMKLLKSLVARVPEGDYLLKLADDLGCEIAFNESCGMDGCLGRYMNATTKHPKRIQLSSLKAHSKCLIFALAHELRHMWQYHVLEGNFHPDLMPKGRLIYNRIIEGDAHAFEYYFIRRYNKTDKNIAPADWQKFFIYFQATDNADGYDMTSIERETKMIKIDEALANCGMRISYTSAFNKAAADELAPIRQILKAGLDQDSPVYAPQNFVSLTESMIRPSTLGKVEKLEQRIKAILP